jgi:hypothetical protein
MPSAAPPAALFLHSRAGFEIPTKSVLKDSSIRPRNLSACSRRNESPASSTEAERSLKIQRKPTTRAKYSVRDLDFSRHKRKF